MTASARRSLAILSLLGALGWSGCPTGAGDDDVGDDDTTPADADGDGWTEDEDCDDADPATHPGAAELCDGADNDCDGLVPADETDADGDGQATCAGDCDDADPTRETLDADGDGHTTCGAAPLGADCDDHDPAVHPGAEEVCDGADNDCDGVQPPWDLDGDGDGWPACHDCNDTNEYLHWGDDDGDGYSPCDGDCHDGDAALNLDDGDGDGYSTCGGPSGQPDCDDTDPALHGGDGDLDGWSPCDGDCDDADAALGPADLDGDGYTTCDGDCDDGQAATYPGAAEQCDAADNDCDGVVLPHETDLDGDGVPVCAGDCDDFDAAVYPGAAQVCDGADDNDCDGVTDAGELDADGDGASPCDGDCDDADPLLDPHDADGDGHSSCDGDCDDAEPAVHPATAEICNDGVDNDCDGTPGACGVFGEWSLADADFIVRGDYYRYFTGERGLADAADLDGDGAPELIGGAYADSDVASYAGAVLVFHGPFAGEIDTSMADAKLTGEAEADQAGWAVAAGGDVDADGVADLLVGATGVDEVADNAGAVYVITDAPPPGTSSLALATARLLGEAEFDVAGYDVEFAGDVDGDGYDDVLVGAPGVDLAYGETGMAYLVAGPVSGDVDLANADARLEGVWGTGRAGEAVAGAGDVNGDGFDDVLVAAPEASGGGRAYLLYGPVSGTVSLNAAALELVGETWPEETQVGGPQGLAPAGDVDGDGYDDFLVAECRWGEFGSPYTGRAHLYLGPPTPGVSLAGADAHVVGATREDETGSHVSRAGDVNGDGHEDLLIGSYQYDHIGVMTSDDGAAVLVYGPLTGSLFVDDVVAAGGALLTGEGWGSEAGQVAYGGDLDGDGYDDILVASPEGAGQGRGALYVFFGGTI